MSLNSLVSTSVATSVDDELLKLTVPALFRTRSTCFSFPCQQPGNVVTPVSAVATQPCELSTLRVLFALSFAFAFLCPLLLVLALVLALDCT